MVVVDAKLQIILAVFVLIINALECS